MTSIPSNSPIILVRKLFFTIFLRIFPPFEEYSGGALGQRLTHSELEELFEGLRRNGLDRNYSHILTGLFPEIN